MAHFRGSFSSIGKAFQLLTNHFLQRAERSPILRAIRLSLRRFNSHNCLLWASALTYTTFLSLVPVLSLALSAAIGFGGVDELRPLVERYVAAGSSEIADRLLSFVKQVDKRTLGTVGGIGLLVTAILTLGTIERAFNTIFESAAERTLTRKFADYLSVIFVLPIVATAIIALSRYFFHFVPRTPLSETLFAGAVGWFTIGGLYVFLPLTTVRLGAAVVGSGVATVLLGIAQSAFIYFQYGVSTYKAIYGALAAIPVFMTWLYMNWLILLYGAELTFALDNKDGSIESASWGCPWFMFKVALLMLMRAAERMTSNALHVSVTSLAKELSLSERFLDPVVRKLEAGGILVESVLRSNKKADRELFLARDPSVVTVGEVAKLLWGCDHNCAKSPDDRVSRFLQIAIVCQDATLGAISLRDLLGSDTKLKLLLEYSQKYHRDLSASRAGG